MTRNNPHQPLRPTPLAVKRESLRCLTSADLAAAVGGSDLEKGYRIPRGLAPMASLTR